ncbi:efflux RND transporter periplasmic adaptor subunit [Temperatibacter marinus]|uniref:Efflux RND transporter periplasmic adaptor subunit n=1 Tax=Temperatibacter marinus TaxID=1456591 RepID=A0AA52EA14_9PROT|nr:efflux RND transporter periplasmic adaptor subunit [Temperatibacter marinus]WND01457.1 efflux RND transporter periplasmic adaptor subunit [Temperatibacter marinus]
MRKLIRILAPIGVLAFFFIIISILGANKPQPQKNEVEARLISLAVDTVVQRDVNFAVQAQGEVRARTEVDLIPQVAGRIVKVSDSFGAGGAFKAGETLIQIDDRDYKLAVTSAQARVAEAEVRLQRQLADAKIKAKQWKEWVKDGSKPTDLALNKPQVAEAEAKLLAAKADLENAELNLSRTKITLPYDGRVREKLADLGQFVNAGTRLGRVFATDVVEVQLALTDTQMAELGLSIGFIAEKGSEPTVTFSASIAGSLRKWEGKIIRTHAAVDQNTRLMYAVAEVRDPYTKAASAAKMPLAVGLFVKAEIQNVNSVQALVMPRVALRGTDRVFIVNAEDKLESRQVNVLATDSKQLYVESGVNIGDRVVVSSVQKVVNGMKVKTYASETDTSSENLAR